MLNLVNNACSDRALNFSESVIYSNKYFLFIWIFYFLFLNKEENNFTLNLAIRYLSLIELPLDVLMCYLVACNINDIISQKASLAIDRVADGEITKLDHVTTYADGTAVVTSSHMRDNIDTIKVLDPYLPGEVGGSNAALTRSYLVGTYTWLAADSNPTEVFRISFPETLVGTQAFLADKLKWYKYIRSRVKVSIRLNSSRFNYGALLIGWLPAYEPVDPEEHDGFRMADLFTLSQCNSLLISAQESGTIEFTIPWISPYQWCHMDTGFGEMGTVCCKILHPLKSVSADAPTNVSISVFAQFVDPEVAGYTPGYAYPALAERLEKKKNRKAKYLNLKRDKVQAQSIISESVSKSTKGILSGVTEAVSTIKPVLEVIPGVISAAESVLKSAGPLMALTGLGKPTSVQALNPVFDRSDIGLALTQGLDLSPNLGQMPENSVSLGSGLLGPENPKMTITEFISKPSLLTYGLFNSASSINSGLASYPVSPTYSDYSLNPGEDVYIYHPCHAGFVAMQHKYWRGSMKYMIRFTTSQYVTCRVRIAHILEDYSGAGDYSNFSGDIVSKIVDIEGDTTVEFSVPYMAQAYYLPVRNPEDVLDHSYDAGTIEISLVTPVRSIVPSTTSVVYYSVFGSGGPDMRFEKLTGPNSTLLSYFSVYNNLEVSVDSSAPTKVEAQCDIVQEFKKNFQGLTPTKTILEGGLVNPEVPMIYSDLGKRYSLIQVWNATGEYDYYPQMKATDVPENWLKLLSIPFLFSRGSVNLTTFKTCETLRFGDDPYLILGATGITIPNGTPILSAHIPWVWPSLFVETVQSIFPGVGQLAWVKDVNDKWVFSSFGDDFSLGCIAPCPWWLYEFPALPKSSTKKELSKVEKKESELLQNQTSYSQSSRRMR